MRRFVKLMLGLAALAALLISSRAEISVEQPAPSEKIALRIFYAGHPGSAREKDFVEFLGKYFTEIRTGNLSTFTGKTANASDVVILDYDGDGFKAPRPYLEKNYARATVTVGVVGSLAGGQLGLKTGYE